SMGSMDMDDGHGHGMGDHGKNAPMVAGARKIAVKARSFKFTPAANTVKAGEDVTIMWRSVDVLYDCVVKGQGYVVSAKGKETASGGLMIDTPGTYKFWCGVAGHRARGCAARSS